MTSNQRAAHDLASLRRWTLRLRQFAEQSDALTVDLREREAFPLEWDNAMDLLDDVETMSVQGKLTPATQRELRDVAGELLHLVPVMKRFRLRVPDQDALARAADRPITGRIV